jgi:Fic family protein
MIQLETYQSGGYTKDPSGYRYFVPTLINEQWQWEDPAINQLVEEAAMKLGELNSFARLVPDIDLFLKMHVAKEAVVSSRIEGTQTKMDEALMDEEEINPERRDDWKEVNNYIRALNQALEALRELPISTRLIRKTHKTLLSSVRGEHKLPGEYRNSQNWIGGNTLSDAVFIPPRHDLVPKLMSDLEEFLHNDEIKVPLLIKIGIAHYQFETIHPFLDGNGRIGRLLITLFLMDKKILHKPLLYLSSYFEKNRGLYYDNLTFVRTKNDMRQWIKYFLAGVTETAENAVLTLTAMLTLQTEIERTLFSSYGKRTASASHLLKHLFQKPILHVKQVQSLLDVSYKTANDLVHDFVQAGILKEMTGQSRNRVFVFQDYIDIF